MTLHSRHEHRFRFSLLRMQKIRCRLHAYLLPVLYEVTFEALAYHELCAAMMPLHINIDVPSNGSWNQLVTGYCKIVTIDLRLILFRSCKQAHPCNHCTDYLHGSARICISYGQPGEAPKRYQHLATIVS